MQYILHSRKLFIETFLVFHIGNLRITTLDKALVLMKCRFAKIFWCVGTYGRTSEAEATVTL